MANHSLTQIYKTYFDREKPRTDIVVTANVLACFYHFGRGYQLTRTLQHIHDALLHRTYIHGTRYYPSSDCCLGFFGRLLQSSNDEAHLQATIGSLLKSRLQERVGESGSALDLALRVLACDSLDIECSVDRDTTTFDVESSIAQHRRGVIFLISAWVADDSKSDDRRTSHQRRRGLGANKSPKLWI